MPLEEISTLYLPYSAVEASTGFAFDMGGSVLKVVYRHKDDWDQAQKQKDKKAPVRLVSFPRHELDEAIKLLKVNCYISPATEAKPKVYATGIGSHQYGPKVEKEFNVSIEVLTEFDCFVKAFVYLVKNVPKQELLHPMSEEAQAETAAVKDAMLKGIEKFMEGQKDGNKMTEAKLNEEAITKVLKDSKMNPNSNLESEATGSDDRPYGETLDVFPCLVPMLGSAFAWFKIEEDGSFAILDGTNNGGRTFLGLGCVLTKAKGYPELIELAAKGNCKNVDVYTSDLAKEAAEANPEPSKDKESNLYETMNVSDQLVFCFGKAVGKESGDFEKEDMAASLLQIMCISTVHPIMQSAHVHDINKIYFTGSFINSQVVRDDLTTQCTRRLMHMSMQPGAGSCKLAQNPIIEFIKGGGHLGALGAFVQASSEISGMKETH